MVVASLSLRDAADHQLLAGPAAEVHTRWFYGCGLKVKHKNKRSGEEVQSFTSCWCQGWAKSLKSGEKYVKWPRLGRLQRPISAGEVIMETGLFFNWNVNGCVGFETAAEDDAFPVMTLRRLTAAHLWFMPPPLHRSPAEPRGRRRR